MVWISVKVPTCANNGKIHQTWVLLIIILGIMMLALSPMLSNNAFAQTLHNRTLYEVVEQTSGVQESSHIPVGDSPMAIHIIDPSLDVVNLYVANSDSNSVSVISAENNTKIKDIAVGEYPVDIEINYDSNTVYVANYDSNSVSVISAENDTKIKDIAVGEERDTRIGPIIPFEERLITINDDLGTIYVINNAINSVSVISAENNTKIGEDIPVGEYPAGITIDLFSDTVYVANYDSNSVSVIDGAANKVVAGITFQVNPFNSGYILCDGLTTPSPIGQHVYVYSGAQCIASPNEGFEFHSWEEKLEGNSTQPIQVSRSASPWDSFVLAVIDFFGDKPDEPESKLNVTKFGTFTANFKELPPAVPSEYWIPLYGIIASTIVGWSIPSIIGWTKSKRDVRKLNYYHKQIASVYDDGRLDENDVERLDRLRSRVADAYSEGKLNEKHYESLRNEISTLYEEIFRKKIAALDNDNSGSVVKKPVQEQLAQIRNEIKYAFSKGKINDKHYALLNEDISKLDNKDGDKAT